MKSIFYLVFIFAISFFSCQSKQEKKQEASNKITANTRCQTCGMPSQEYPKWQVKHLKNQVESYFCSPRCMFVAATKTPTNISLQDTIWAVDYYEQKKIDALQAFYVINSDITGPMGHDFVPFATQNAAQDFLQEHKGTKIVTFKDVTPDMITTLGK
jgi:copper chaperone NosL